MSKKAMTKPGGSTASVEPSAIPTLSTPPAIAIGAVPDGKVVDFLTGKLVRDTPEEYVRQNIEKALIRQYRYSASHCQPEFRIKMGSAKPRVDIAVFPPDEKHEQAQALILIETKKPGTSPQDKRDGIGQLQSYMAACPNALYGLWTNGDDRFCLAKRVKAGRVIVLLVSRRVWARVMRLLPLASQSVLAISLIVCMLSLRAHASTVMPVNFKQTIDEADFIVGGTVSHMEYASESSFVFTIITLQGLDVIKGDWSEDSMVIRVVGGKWKGSVYKLVGYPKFQMGSRYVLCLKSGLGTASDRYKPIVFWNQGFFPVTQERLMSRPVIHDYMYRPVLSIENDNLVVLSTPSRPSVEDPRPKSLSRQPHIPAHRDTVRGYESRIARVLVPVEIDPGTRLDERMFASAIRAMLKQH